MAKETRFTGKKPAGKSIKTEDTATERTKETLPATLNKDLSPKLVSILENIQDGLQAVVQRQNSHVSPEFNALMDGYVNKANESETLKVKFEHIQNQHDEMKLELKNLKDANKQYSSDIEAAREALRLSESDLHQFKKDFDQMRAQYEEKVTLLSEEKERLKIKVRDLLDLKEKSSSDQNGLKAELLEYKHKFQQVEQEKNVELESSKRTLREHEKIIEELKEQLELRTREVEYKDALLNQLIRQASVDDNKTEYPRDFIEQQMPVPKASSLESIPQSAWTSPQTVQPIPNAPKSNYQGSRWGAFRK